MFPDFKWSDFRYPFYLQFYRHLFSLLFDGCCQLVLCQQIKIFQFVDVSDSDGGSIGFQVDDSNARRRAAPVILFFRKGLKEICHLKLQWTIEKELREKEVGF